MDSLECPSSYEINTLVDLFNQGRYTEGEALAKGLTVRYPHDGVGWKLIGAMLNLQGRSAEALESMKKAADLSPGDAEAHGNLGTILQEQGRLVEAESSYRRALKINPNDADAHYNLGNTLKEQGRLIDAEASYRRALKINPNDADAHNNLGNTLKDQGLLTDAEACYRRALKINPHHADAHNNLGNTLKDQGRLVDAETSYRRALEINPRYVEAHSNLGSTLKERGRLTDAEASYRLVLEINPRAAEAHYNLGNILKEQGRHTEAEVSYRRIVEIKPGDAEAHYNLGNTLKDQGRLMDSETSYRRALEIKSDFAEAYSNLGITLKDQGRFPEAEASYRRALEIKSDFAEAHNNLGNALWEQGRFVEAEDSYRRALEINPNDAKAHCNLGNTINDQGRLMEAETSYRRALEINPNYADAYNSMGSTLKGQGRLTEAEACYRRALEINPNYSDAYNNLGGTLKDQGRLTEAEASYRRALEINPQHAVAHSNLIFTLNYSPGNHISYCLEEAYRYGQLVNRKVGTRFTAWQCVPRPERLRVGLVSGDLLNHPVGYFLENVLAHIDSTRIELIAYSTSSKEDELTARIKPCFYAWKSLVGRSDKAAASLIHEDGVHLLIDLSGHTAKNRLPVFAWKPAPVQASWLGYSGTTGVSQIDYFLGDPFVAPKEEDSHFTERIWRLPESYLCFTPPSVPVEIGTLPALTTGRITFGCFNNLTKMGDDVVTLWSRVLNTIIGSKLFLRTRYLNDLVVLKNTIKRFAAHGIASDRLILEGKLSTRAEMFEAYNRVDIALDPFPYSGTTTSVEGLWMGVPVITRRGDRFLSHIGESIASNAGLVDWIAKNDDDYVAKSVMHTTDLERLSTIRAHLRQQVLVSPLFDASRFARHFEAALWGMWEKSQNDQRITV